MWKKILHCNIGAAIANMLVAYLVFMLSRVAFFVENWSTFAPYATWQSICNAFHGALIFDTSALLYINSVYLALMLLPLHLKEKPGFHKGLRWLFVVTNAVGVASNLMDSVFFQYTGRRSTISVFSEFSNENNIASIILTEALRHWYLVVVFIVLVLILWRCFTQPRREVYPSRLSYYLTQSVALLVMVPLAIVGIRGSTSAGTRPITIINANEFVDRPVEASLVLNTPFSMIRSIGKKVFITPEYMTNEQMESIYSPVHSHPVVDSLSHPGKNVVILIVESMGKVNIGSFNPDMDGGKFKGYMPFIDSLIPKSLTYKYSYANGRISMDAMPSLLSGLPMMVEPFFLTPASLNDLEGLPKMLSRMGYHSAFFHGAHNRSMSFNSFAHAVGYQRYYGLDEYCQSPKYGGMDDWDGKWAIWDEPFLQFSLDNINGMQEPFLATVFTASSHHPFNLPEQYRDSLKEEGGMPIYKCVRYADLSLRRFFEQASKQPWYNNTIFVIVADHTNNNNRELYLTDLGWYSIPIIFFTPDGSIAPAMRDDIIAQQTDVTPTLLHMLGYDKPYLAFGFDLLSADPSSTWAFSYNSGVYQLVKGDLMLQFNGTKTTAVYRFKTDLLLKNNLVGQLPEQQPMEQLLKAIIQQYMSRMNENRLLPDR